MEERMTFFHKISPSTHLVFAGVIFLILLVGYIVQVNASSTKAYALRDAQHHHEELVHVNDRLVAEIDRLRSLSSVMERKAFLDLQPVQHISYITPSASNTVALK
jgi:hypothetical protein